jgi:hypothetical protein
VIATFLLNNLWFDLLLWLAIYASDYSLTIYQMSLYHRGMQGEVQHEGSLELNPYFQADVERQRKFSLRWFLMAFLTSLMLASVWWLSVRGLGLPGFFWFVLGMLYLLQAAVHVRHLTNIVFFRQILRGEASGKIEYSMKGSLLTSAGQFIGFAILFFLCFLLTTQWFFLGGAFACTSLSLNHAIRAGRLPTRRAAAPPAVNVPPPPESRS